MSCSVTLVRHPPVDASFRGICYGSSDVPLGADGPTHIDALVDRLARLPVSRIVHSGLSRTSLLASSLAERIGIEPMADVRLRECHFGEWELRRWDDIYAETGDAMMGMIHAPNAWRPPRGETVLEMRDRVMDWYRELPGTGQVVAVTHGGPIAAILGTLRGRPAASWMDLIPRPGDVVSVRPQRA